MTTHPSIASQLEKMEAPTSQLSPDCFQTEDGLSLDMLLWTLYFVEIFLRSCRKSGKFLSVRDYAFRGSL